MRQVPRPTRTVGPWPVARQEEFRSLPEASEPVMMPGESALPGYNQGAPLARPD